MANTKFSAAVKDFARRTKENMELVMRHSIEDVLEQAQQSQQSMARFYKDGSYGPHFVEQGKIPVDVGFLINSTASSLNGTGNFDVVKPADENDVGSPTEPTFEMTIAEMKSGMTAQFAWTAVYAKAVNYGHGTYPGAHWVDVNAAKWPAIVEKNAEKFSV